MNFFEAERKQNKGQKIRRKAWPEGRYHEFRFYGDKKPRTTHDDMFADDWEIVNMHITITEQEYQELMRVKRELEVVASLDEQ